MKRTVLITGATRGLGREMALHFAQAGYQVALNYANNDQNAQDSLDLIKSEVPEAVVACFKADAMSEAGVNTLVTEVTAQLGSPDTVVINATPDQPELSLFEYDDALFDAMYKAFVMSPHYITKAVVPAMKEAQFGRIIHITSEVFQNGVPNFTAYVAAKGGQNGYLRSSAMEVAEDGITINAIAPGWIPVERHAEVSQEHRDSYVVTTPMRKWGKPADVANCALFFAQEQSGFLTAQTLSPTGGRTIGML